MQESAQKNAGRTIILLFLVGLWALPVCAKNYLVSIGQDGLGNEIVGENCDGDKHCTIKVLVQVGDFYNDKDVVRPFRGKAVITAELQFIDQRVFIFFKSNGRYLFPSHRRRVFEKPYFVIALNAGGQAERHVNLYDKKPQLDDGITSGNGDELVELIVHIRPEH